MQKVRIIENADHKLNLFENFLIIVRCSTMNY